MNWDDIRIFLAVARQGSVRSAALKLNVNHSTVSRRIAAFEETMNVRLFERMPNGYLLTLAGEDLLKAAVRMEEEVASVDRKIVGRDDRMSGTLRVTLPAVLANTVLIEEFSNFCELYPDIKLELNCSYELVDLNKREADLAIRATNEPPENLVGRQICSVGKASYISRKLWARICDENDPIEPCWMAWDKSVKQEEYIKSSIFPNAKIRHTISDHEGLYIAVKSGMGIAELACQCGDQDPEIMRLPPGKADLFCSLWVLTHRDLRHTLRVKTFMDYTAKILLKHKSLLEGNLPVIQDVAG